MRIVLYIIFFYKLSIVGQTNIYNTQLPILFLFDESIDTSYGFNIDNLNKTKIYFNYYYNQIYLEKSNDRIVNDIGNWNYLIGLKKGVKVFNTPILLNASYGKDKKFLISRNKGDEYNYNLNDQQFKFNIYKAINVFYLHTGINIQRYDSKVKVHPSFNLDLHLFDNLSLGYGFETDQNNWNFLANNSEEIFDYKQREYRETNKFNLVFSPLKHITFKGIYYSSKLNPKSEPEKNMNVISAKGKSSHIFGECRFNDILGFDIIGINFHNFNLNADGHFYSDKVVFGQITSKKASYTNYNFNITKRFTKSVLESCFSIGKAHIESGGYADTWPFSDFWTDLLGLRYWADAEIQYDYFSSAIDYKNYFSKKAFYKVMLMYEQIQPVGRSKTWQPDILVFGIKNLQINETDIIRQNGLYFSGEIFYTFFKKISLGYQLSQYIPVYSEKTDKKNGQKSKTSGKNFKYGGGQHFVKLQIEL